MCDSQQANKSQLALLLYEIYFNRDKSLEEWTDVKKEYYLKEFGIEKIQILGNVIIDYFNYGEIDLLSILPNMKATLQEREAFLKFIYNGFIQSGFIEGEIL